MKNYKKIYFLLLACFFDRTWCAEQPRQSKKALLTSYLPSQETQNQVLTAIGSVAYTVGSVIASTALTVGTHAIKYASGSQLPLDQTCQSHYNLHPESDSEEEDTTDFYIIGESTKEFFSDEEELYASLSKNPGATVHKLNQAVTKCFQEHDPKSLRTQERLSTIIKMTQSAAENQPDFILPAIIANQYNADQAALLQETLIDHATRREPTYKKNLDDALKAAQDKRDATIAAAVKICEQSQRAMQERYDHQVNALAHEAKIIAGNSAYINQSATKKRDLAGHDQTYYSNQKEFLSLLSFINQKDE